MEKKNTDWLNEAIYLFSRPWLLGLALFFILTPAVRLSRALETGAEFLKIDTDARAVSMGSAYTAAADGVNSIAYNTAGLASLTGVELSFSHTNWLLDSRHDFVGFGMPIGGRKASSVNREASGMQPEGWMLGLGITRLTTGGLESRTADRSASGGFSAYDQSVSLAVAKAVAAYKAGLAAKYIESSIAGEKAMAVAVDMGVTRALNHLPVGIGLSVQNLGTPMRYIDQKDRLPLTLSAGFLLSVVPGFNFALDVKRLIYDRQTGISFGTEYSFLPGLALRTGYLMNNASLNPGNKGFSAGAGVNFMKMQADYSFTPFGALGDAQKITLKKKF